MGVNLLGLAAGFQGFQDEQRRIREDEQRAKAQQRQEQDSQFQEEIRNRQRTDWARIDKNQALDEADFAELRERLEKGPQESNKSPLVAPALGMPTAPLGNLPAEVASVRKLDALKEEAPMKASGNAVPPANAESNKASIIAPVGGIPQPRNFNSVLDMQREVLNRKLARGTLSAQDFAQSVAALNKIKSEGIHQALELMTDGDYQAGVDAYNAVGRMRGARVVEGKPGVTKLDNGEEVPTHFVTIQNADGSRAVMDVAQARYQLLDMDRLLLHKDAAAKNRMQRDQHESQVKFGYVKLDREAQAAAANNSVQAAHVALSRQQLFANSPAGKIQSIEAAMGRPLHPSEKAGLLGLGGGLSWAQHHDDELFKAYTRKNEATGAIEYDGDGLKFAKQVAVAASRNGDNLSAIATALAADNNLRAKAAMGEDGKALPPLEAQAKLTQLRQQALASLYSASAKPAAPTLPATASRTSAPLLQVGGITGQPQPLSAEQQKQQQVNNIAQVLGLSSDQAMNDITLSKAGNLFELAQQLKQEEAGFRAASISGDAAASKNALSRVNAIKVGMQAYLPDQSREAMMAQILTSAGM